MIDRYISRKKAAPDTGTNVDPENISTCSTSTNSGIREKIAYIPKLTVWQNICVNKNVEQKTNAENKI